MGKNPPCVGEAAGGVSAAGGALALHSHAASHGLPALFLIGCGMRPPNSNHPSASTSGYGALDALPEATQPVESRQNLLLHHTYLESVGPAASAGLLELATLGAHVRLDGVVGVQVVDAANGVPQDSVQITSATRGAGGHEFRATRRDAMRRCNGRTCIASYHRRDHF